LFEINRTGRNFFLTIQSTAVPTSSWKGSPIGVSQITSATGAKLYACIGLKQCLARFKDSPGGSATALVFLQAPFAPIYSFVIAAPFPTCSLHAKARHTARFPAFAADEAAAHIANIAPTFVTPPHKAHVCGQDFVESARLKTKAGDGFLQRIVISIPEVLFVQFWR
jgi:hypothetical protein